MRLHESGEILERRKKPCKSTLLSASPNAPVETSRSVETHLKIKSAMKTVGSAHLCSLGSLPVVMMTSPLLLPAASSSPSKRIVAVFSRLNMLHTGERGQFGDVWVIVAGIFYASPIFMTMVTLSASLLLGTLT